MTKYDYDLFVIGAGSGGVRAARMAAGHGASVAITEEYRVGGTCVIRGCIPKKLFVYAAHYAQDFEDAAGYGWSLGEGTFDWSTLVANKDKEIDRLNGIYIRNLEASGVKIFEKRGVLVNAHTVDLEGEQVTAETILVATGARPMMPDVLGIEHAITSDEAFHLEQLPDRIIIVGGGYIAVEFAGIFHGLGVEVTQLYRGEQILRGFDRDIRDTLAGEMRREGIDLRVDARVTAVEKTDAGLTLELDGGGTLETDMVLYATGRVPNTESLGLEAAGVELGNNGAINVDEYSQSSVPNIYAVGDVTDRMALTPVAIAEAMAFAETVYGGNPTAMDYGTIAGAVFSQPSVGTVGYTEEEARAEFGDLDVYKSGFTPLKHTLTGRGERTMMKLVVERATDRVLGLHMVGPEAGEIAQSMAVALKMGATKAQFDATVSVHPTAAEEFVTMREKLPD